MREVAKILSYNYCIENYFLMDGYFYLDEDDCIKNRTSPVYAFLDTYLCGSVQEIHPESTEPWDEFVECILSIDEYPEYFL